jgi:hypothetical protein
MRMMPSSHRATAHEQEAHARALLGESVRADGGAFLAARSEMSLLDVVFGRRLATAEEEHQRIGP